MQTIAVCRLTRKAGLAIISRYVRFPDEEHNSHTIRNKRMKAFLSASPCIFSFMELICVHQSSPPPPPSWPSIADNILLSLTDGQEGWRGHIILGLKRDSIRNCKQAEKDLQWTLKFQGIESQDYAQTAFVFFPVMKHISFSKKSTARCWTEHKTAL